MQMSSALLKHLDHAADDIAGQAGEEARDLRRIRRQQVVAQLAQRKAGDAGPGGAVGGGLNQPILLVQQQRLRIQVRELGVGQQRPCVASAAGIVAIAGHADRFIAFFVLVGRADDLTVQRGIEGAALTADVGKDVFTGLDLGDAHRAPGRRRRGFVLATATGQNGHRRPSSQRAEKAASSHPKRRAHRRSGRGLRPGRDARGRRGRRGPQGAR